MSAVAVLGAGCAGLAAADALVQQGVDVALFEAQAYWGGHTHSVTDDGFTFDEGPHVSFTKDEAVAAAFARGAELLHQFDAQITNRFRGAYVTHPAQCHLYGLDPDLIARCLVDFVTSRNENPEIHTYADWCRAMFGRTFAETFPFSYTRKYWTVEADQMSTDWIGARMYPPKLEEVIRGALIPEQEGEFHYLSSFRYPAQGGYQAFLRSFLHPDILQLNKRAVAINTTDRSIEFSDGSRSEYEELICTIPLPEIVRTAGTSVPPAVLAATEELLCTSLVLVDVAVNRSDLSDHHWFYVYDDDYSISRGHFPHMLASANAPAGCGSIQLEVYHSRHRPLPCRPDLLVQRVVEELQSLEVIRDPDEVLWARHREVQYANVVFDHRRQAALSVILPWASQQGITLAGRYAEWGYHWTDDSVRAGWSAADQVLARLCGAKPAEHQIR